MSPKTIRIGGGQGFWGDSPDAAIDMIHHGNLNYMATDYLAELTMSILQKQKNRNPEAGYARDFIDLMNEIAGVAYEKGIKIISNAGGVNVEAAARQIKNLAEKQNLKGYKIAYVSGDNLLGEINRLLDEGYPFTNMDTGEPLTKVKDRVMSANVYHGAEPIISGLEEGADVVITGRAADSSMFLAPLKYEFGWKDDDYDNIAKGNIVGHLLECGGQATGGNYDYDWRAVPDMDRLGFPIAEVSEDDLIITKTTTSGGLVTEQSLKEQLLYEIHDPANYITPDCIANVQEVTMKEIAKDRVRIEHIKGKKRTDTLKLSMGYTDGYRVTTMLSYAWPDAYEKAKYASEIIMKKMKRKNLQAEDIKIDFIGLNALHLDVADMSEEILKNQNEVIMRIALRTKTKEEALKLVPEIAPLQLNGPPGSSFVGGRSKVSQVIALWPTLLPRDMVNLGTHFLEV